MRAALLILALAVPAFGLVSPCSIPTLTRSEAWAVVGDIVMFDGAQPEGQCGFEFSTTTPSVIAVDGFARVPGGFRINVHALAPGEGILIVHGFLPGATEYTRTAAIVHVAVCEPAVRLQPSYTASVKAPVHIDAEVHGTLSSPLLWYVNGVLAGEGASLTFVPPSAGTYFVSLYGSSSCGMLRAQSTLSVVAETPHFRAVRRR